MEHPQDRRRDEATDGAAEVRRRRGQNQGNVGVLCVAFSPTGNRFAAGSGNKVQIFELGKAKPADNAKLPSSERQVSEVSCVAMGPRDNPCVAVGIAD